jgi:hypothetical protein
MLPIPNIGPHSWLLVRHDRSVTTNKRRDSRLQPAGNIAAHQRFGRTAAAIAVAVSAAVVIKNAFVAALDDDLAAVTLVLVLIVAVLAVIAPLLGGAQRGPRS